MPKKATELGIDAIRTELDEIAAIESHDDIYRAFGSLGVYGVDGPIGGFIFSDLKDPDTTVVYLSESGITLPDRDYYLLDDEQFVKGRELFRTYVASLFELAGVEGGADKAEASFSTGTSAGPGALDQGRQPRSGEDLQSQIS